MFNLCVISDLCLLLLDTIELTSWLIRIFVDMDEGGPSNWNSNTYNNPDEYDNQNEYEVEELQRIRRRRRRVALAAVIATYSSLSLQPRQRIHTSSLPGWKKVDEYLQGNPRSMFNRVRMTPYVFLALCTCLKERNLVNDTRGLSVEEQLFIFLSIVAQSQNNRAVQDDFQHSAETITRHFTNVLKAVAKLRHDFIRAPDYEETPQFLQDNAHKFLPWFEVL